MSKNEFDSSSISSHFEGLADPRRLTANRRHAFNDVLVIAISAIICGADDWVHVEQFGKAKEEWFSSFLDLPNGIPSHDTFTDIFSKLCPDSFEKCFVSWVNSIIEIIPDEVVAIDGKTLRRSHDLPNSKKAIHIVSAYASDNELVLGQVKTAEKSNEITAIPALIDTLLLKGCLVTIDAMGCQKKIVDKIIESEADYLIAVKDNQPSLHDNIIDKFNQEEINEFSSDSIDYFEDECKGHGRTEYRRCWTCNEIPACISKKWGSVNAIVMIKSQRTIGDRTSIEHRYYITSSNKNADSLLSATRKHWSIENKLHWSLDVSFREDESRVRCKYGAQNLSTLRHIALNLLKKEKSVKVGIKGKRLNAGWDNNYLKKVLNGLVP
jgi:predicted transposase YbfD/YdcC